ncbi:MAG: archease [Pirellulales bacterium]
MFEIFAHTADLGLRIRASDLNELYAEAGRGLLAVIVRNPQDVRPDVAIEFQLEETQLDFLLVDWLTELLFAFESRHLLLARFEAELTDGRLTAKAWGEPCDETRHQLEHEVKAVTYHGLTVRQVDGEWLAEVILDI